MIDSILDLIGDLAGDEIASVVEAGVEAYKKSKDKEVKTQSQQIEKQVEDRIDYKSKEQGNRKLRTEPKNHVKKDQKHQEKTSSVPTNKHDNRNSGQYMTTNQVVNGLDANRLREAMILSEIVGKPMSKKRHESRRR